MKPSELQTEAFDRTSGWGDYPRIEEMRKIIAEICANGKTRILDVGCGDGTIIAPFIKGNECYGVDIGKTVIQRAKKRGINGYVVNIDEDSLPFKDEYFDVVVCGEVIEHMINTDHVLKEINRVMIKDDTLILSFPNVNQPASLFVQFFWDYPPLFSARYKSTHFRDFSLKIRRKALENNGFEVINVKGTFLRPFKNKFSRRLAHKFPRLGEKIIVVANKTSVPETLPVIAWDTREI